MKLRNQLLALFCLAIFVGFGFLYFRTYVAPKPFGVILFLSDGMSARQITAARLYEGGAEHRLTIDGFPSTALLRNSARDFSVPDTAAAASALATGEPGMHRHLSVDANGNPLPTLLELARREGRSVGLITNGAITDPAVAAFYAHTSDTRDSRTIVDQFLRQNHLDVALGGGAQAFIEPGDRPKDRLAELSSQPVDLYRTKAELESAENYRSRRIVGLFAPGDLAHADQIESGTGQPSLADMVRRAIECLQTNRGGYFLVVDAALITRAAERNEGERTLMETLAFDRAVATAVRYAGDHALIIAAGKHGVGGLTLNGYPLRQEHGLALLGMNPIGYPALTWSTGPKGPEAKPAQKSITEPAAAWQGSAVLTAEDMIAVGRGPGSEQLRGIIDSTEIFSLLRSAF